MLMKLFGGVFGVIAFVSCSEAPKKDSLELRITRDDGQHIETLRKGENHGLRLWLRSKSGSVIESADIKIDSSECLNTDETNFLLTDEQRREDELSSHFIVSIPKECQDHNGALTVFSAAKLATGESIESSQRVSLALSEASALLDVQVSKLFLNGFERQTLFPEESLKLDFFLQNNSLIEQSGFRLKVQVEGLKMDEVFFDNITLAPQASQLMSQVLTLEVPRSQVPDSNLSLVISFYESPAEDAVLVHQQRFDLQVAPSPELQILNVAYHEGKRATLVLQLHNASTVDMCSGSLEFIGLDESENSLDLSSWQTLHFNHLKPRSTLTLEKNLVLKDIEADQNKEIKLLFKWRSHCGYSGVIHFDTLIKKRNQGDIE
jgi:hypothetical protein